MTQPTRPKPCLTCGYLRATPRGRRKTHTCGKSGTNAYAERANPNGCGPGGKHWSATAPKASAAMSEALNELAKAQAAVRDAALGQASGP